jgi:Uma2 family endonuclease
MSTIPSISTPLSSAQREPLTLVDLANRFGEIPLGRICQDPPPGEATEADLLYYSERRNRLFELVDGTLIEKTMGNFESIIAGYIHNALQNYLHTHRIGLVMPADGQLKLKPDTIRVPDVCFITRERAKQSNFLQTPIASLSPNLAVEVISKSNSKREMSDKLAEYFASGTEEVWYVYPEQRELHQYTAVNVWQVLKETDTLTSPQLLPDFVLPIASIFVDPLADEPHTAPPAEKG